ncbi:MAG: sigma-70 family RNA polymerase sigma factor [Verrucomicrobia bacterium]|nr:sigma-70 family RNA polymerase sigma factor [Verrucomicrobiota bacterium]
MAAERFYHPLYLFAYGLTRNQAEALDLTQQTFLRLAQRGHQLRAPDKLRSWLFTTLRREFLRLARRRSCHPEVAFQAGQHESAIHGAAPAPAVRGDGEAAARALDAGAILDALQQVEPAYRETLQLFYLAEMSYREIAQALAVPIGTVMSRLARGKGQLRARLRTPPAQRHPKANSRRPASRHAPESEPAGTMY